MEFLSKKVDFIKTTKCFSWIKLKYETLISMIEKINKKHLTHGEIFLITIVFSLFMQFYIILYTILIFVHHQKAQSLDQLFSF